LHYFADLVLQLTIPREAREVIRDGPPTRQSAEQAVDRALQ
jgi:hypothetical protein